MRNNDYEFEDIADSERNTYVNEEKLENEILAFKDYQSDVEELYKNNKISLDAYLALTHKRVNCIKWYELSPNSSVLEIGGGVGEITGYLCEKAGSVVSFEIKPARAKVIRERYRGYTNLKVVDSDFSNIDSTKRYDYIFIHDVLPLSRKRIKAEEASVEMLKICRNLLKSDGRLLLCVENRLGIKYFLGSAEDYSRQFFWGLNGFDEDERVRTYSKADLEQIIKRAGFDFQNWYYLYPDAVCTMEVYSEGSREKYRYGSLYPYEDIASDRYQFFDEKRMLATLYRNNVELTFANAFFVEVTNNEEPVFTSYANLNDDYKVINDRGEFVLSTTKERIPDGIRADYYLNDKLIEVVDCNMGKKNPFVSEIYDFWRLVKDCTEGCYRLEDLFYDGKELHVVNKRIDKPSEYCMWEICYNWYYENLMFYRNGNRRIRLEDLYSILEISKDKISEYLTIWNNNRINNSKKRVSRPPIMFDFEAESCKNSLMFYDDMIGEETLSMKLKEIHKGVLH